MKSLLTSILVSSALLVACGGNAPDAKDPSKTDTSTPDTKAGDTSVKPTDTKPADATPTDAKPEGTKTDTTAKPADTTPASDDASKCKDAPKPTAKTKKACMAECSKLEATAPAGSKCVPPKTACEEQCKTLK
jgi:hypothetical protein